MVNNEAARTPAIRTHSFSVILLVLFMLSASHILLYDYLGVRLLAQILFGGAIVVLFGPAVLRQSYYLNNYGPLAILCLVYIFFEIVWRQEVKNVAGYAGAFFLIMAVSSFSTFKLEYFSRILLFILLSFSLAAFVQVVIIFIDPTLTAYIIKSIDTGYYGKISIRHPIEWLGNADSIAWLFGIGYPRFSSYIDQASAMPAYFLLPSAIILISHIKHRNLAYIPIIFSVVSMGGGVIFCLITSGVIYLLCRRLPRLFLTALPFVMLISFLLIIVLLFSDAVHGDQLFESSKTNHPFVNYLAGRAVSGLARVTIIIEGIESIISSPVFGIENSTEKFGSLILTSGQRAGFLGMIVAILAFAMLFRNIASAMHSVRGDAHTIYGLALLYAVAAQAMIYNDYGFSKFWGLTMFSVAYVMLQKLPHLRAPSQASLSKN